MVHASTSSARVFKVGSKRFYKNPSQVAKLLQDKDIVEIDAGIYIGDVAIWKQSGITLKGVGGFAHMKAAGRAAEGKAIWVIKGADVTVESIEFSGAQVSQENGAGIRQEGPGLIVRNCFFHDNENGILGGNGSLTVENSEFSNNGFGDGYSHNIYIGKNTRRFTLKYSYVHHAKVGHNIKSRAVENYIKYNRIMDEGTGDSSYLIDLPQGGDAYIVGNLLQQGQLTHNNSMISYGAEIKGDKKNQEELFLLYDLHIINNTFVNEKDKGVFINVKDFNKRAIILNNLFVGEGNIKSGPSYFMGNIKTTRPKFYNRATYNYHLTADSPAIDAGKIPTDLGIDNFVPDKQYKHPADFEKRSIKNQIDVGAYEYTK